MIHAMKPIHAVASLLLCLANLPHADATIDLALAPQSTPELNVLVYSFPGFSTRMLYEAEIEAMRVLHPVHMELSWIDCTSRPFPISCTSPQKPTDLVVRFIRKALPQASTSALGIAGSTDNQGVAFVFYDRVLALRTATRSLPLMLGRVIAHELTHLLLPEQGHSDVGLMRGQWAADDLRITSSACLRLPTTSVQFMEKEALRRVLSANSLGK